MFAMQARRVRRELGGRLEGRTTGTAVLGICSAAAVMGALTWIVWALLDAIFGRSLLGQCISVFGGLAAGSFAYARAVLWLGVGEAHQVVGFVVGRVPALRGPLGLRA